MLIERAYVVSHKIKLQQLKKKIVAKEKSKEKKHKKMESEKATKCNQVKWFYWEIND